MEKSAPLNGESSTQSSGSAPNLPILYSFRRCPYAMRARMAVSYAGLKVELREIELTNKPSTMLDLSSKGTVPILVLPDGQLIEESFDIMLWALSKNDPEDATGLAHYLEHMVFKGTSKIATINWEKEKVVLKQISDLYELRRNTVDENKRKSITK